MKRFVKISGIITFVLAGVFISPVGVMAQEFLKNYATPLPKVEFLPEKDFESKTTLYGDVPGGDAALSYSLRLPKDWTKPENTAVLSYQVSDKLLGEIARFYGPPIVDVRSMISLQAINLEYKLTALQWLLEYLLSSGFTIQGMQEYDRNRAEALYVKVENDITYAIRCVVQLNGKRAVLMQYMVPTESWDTEKVMQAQVIKSFKLTNPVDELVEPMTKYHFIDLAEFSYPQSWEFKAVPMKSAEQMSFTLLNVVSEKKSGHQSYKTLNGQIQVDIISSDLVESEEAAIENLKENLSKLNLVVGEPLEKHEDFIFSPRLEKQPVQVFKVVDSQSNLLQYEYWIVAIAYEDYYYFISLITPSRDDDYFIWARNSETYKLVVEMFKPLDDSVMSR